MLNSELQNLRGEIVTKSKGKASVSAPFLASFEETLAAFARGQPVILVDDEDRENEGDITVATQFLTVELLALMTRKARGLVCVSIPNSQGEKLQLPLQAGSNRSRFDTPFTVSVDLATTQTSAHESPVSFQSRVRAMQRLADPLSSAEEFISPGNVYPLMAHPAGVLGRRGQTEGAYDLARLSGLFPSGVICEVLNDDGTVARGAQLHEFAARYSMPIIAVQQIIDYRLAHDTRVSELSRSYQNTKWGRALVVSFEDEASKQEHVAVVFGEPDAVANQAPPLIRLHSECLTGDVFGSVRCDCGPQLSAAAQTIVASGSGVILYLRQEGRGIGLGAKLKAYALQDNGADTVEANRILGLPVDARQYGIAARMLQVLGISRCRLLTNNPDKVAQLSRAGIEVLERLAVLPPLGPLATSYLETKQRKMGHFT